MAEETTFQEQEPNGEEEEEKGDGDDSSLSSGELRIVSFIGILTGYFTVSGSLALFTYLDWIGIASVMANLTSPFGGAGEAILGIVSLFVNFALLLFLMVNARPILDEVKEREIVS